MSAELLKEIGVIIPAYNEMASLPSVIRNTGRAIENSGYIPLFIVVDDGSSDDTARIARKELACWPGSRLLKFPFNRGKGSAVRAGVHAVKSDLFMVLPADNQFDIATLPGFLAKIQDADIVQGIRNRSMRNPMAARVSWLHNQTLRLLFGIPARDVNWVFLARTGPIKQLRLRTRGFAIEAEIWVKMFRAGYTFAEIQSNELPRNFGTGLGVNPWYILNAALEILALWGSMHISGCELPDPPRAIS